MKIIYVDMVADLFHAGHVQFLEHASTFGDKLIVGINSDKDVKSYKRKTIISCKDRAKVVNAIHCVSRVIAPCPLVISEEFIEKNNIDLVVHAHDEDDKSYDFMYNIPIKLGKFKRINYTPGISTTDIIKRCQFVDNI